MKNLITIIAILLIAFTVDAQSTRSRTSSSKSPQKSSVHKSGSSSKTSATRSSAARTRSSSPSTKSSATRSGSSSSTRSSATRTRSSSPSTRSSATRTRSSSPSTRSSATRSGSSSSTRSSATRTRSSSPSTRSSESNGPQAGSSAVRNSNASRSSSGVSRSSNSTTRTVNKTNRSNQSVRGGTNVYRPRTSATHVAERKVYTTYMPSRVKRPVTHIHYTSRPIEYRRVHYPYIKPRHINIYWDVHMYHEYSSWYPNYNLWYYPFGYSINTISAYDAYRYIGEIARVYGEVYETWYERKTDRYYLYFGNPYPYQDFTIIMEGHDARHFSRNPIRFFTKRNIEVTGLVSSFDGKPEIAVKRKKQVRPY